MNRLFIQITSISQLFCLITVLHASATPSDNASRKSPAERKEHSHFKGVELYSIYDAQNEEWRFGWLPGTNRLKSAAEVTHAIKIVGVKALKRELAKFAENEKVFVVDNDSPLKPKGVELSLPEKKVLKELRAFCTARHIEFNCRRIAEDE